MSYISPALRREVIMRASNCCEYCRVSQETRIAPYQIDHIVAEKHGGETIPENLCFACYHCNGHKGSDIASIDYQSAKMLTWLFNPRTQNWDEHFLVEDGLLVPLTPEGRVTVRLLKLNRPDVVNERRILSENGLFPC